MTDTADQWIDLHRINYMAMRLPMLVMYDHPTDYPAHVIIRIWDLDEPTKKICLFTSIEDAESSIPNWFVRLAPQPGDDPKIVGVYV